MLVAEGAGAHFSDPATQAAIAAQSGQPAAPAAEPAPKPTPEPIPATPPDTPATPAVEPVVPASAAAPEAAEVVVEPTHQDKTDETKAVADDDLQMKAPDKEPKRTIENMSPENLDAVLKEEGFDGGKIGEAMAANDGKVPAELIAKLKEKFDTELVDTQVADVESRYKEQYAVESAKVTDMNDYIYGSLAGGDVEKGVGYFKELSTWCQANMTADALGEVNEALASGNQETVKAGLTQAVEAWKTGKENKMMTGDAAASAAADTTPTFEPLSRDEFQKLVGTEKYQTDVEYAAEVDTRRRKTIDGGGQHLMTPEFGALRPPI